MLIDYAAITHQGCVRTNNEDAYLVSALDGEEPLVNGLRRRQGFCPMGLLAAVADGMGGAAAGEIASREGLASLAVNLFGRWGRFPVATYAPFWNGTGGEERRTSVVVARNVFGDATDVLGDEQRILWLAVARLNERCQRLLRVIAFDERPDYARIAQDLAMPVGSIGPTRQRCLVKLRALLEDDGYERELA